MRRAWLVLMLLACKPVGPASGVIEVQVTAKGFEPDRIAVRHMLPLGAPIDVKVTPPPSGQLAFACPMNMYRGAVVVVGQ